MEFNSQTLLFCFFVRSLLQEMCSRHVIARKEITANKAVLRKQDKGSMGNAQREQNVKNMTCRKAEHSTDKQDIQHQEVYFFYL